MIDDLEAIQDFLPGDEIVLTQMAFPNCRRQIPNADFMKFVKWAQWQIQSPENTFEVIALFFKQRIRGGLVIVQGLKFRPHGNEIEELIEVKSHFDQPYWNLERLKMRLRNRQIPRK